MIAGHQQDNKLVEILVSTTLMLPMAHTHTHSDVTYGTHIQLAIIFIGHASGITLPWPCV